MDQREFEATLADAEIRLRRLRTLYDQWFHGLERTEPRTQRSDIDRIITELRRAQPRNTALRFRFNQLVQRYTTYTTYWQRISRQIEEGTYKRDVLRARRRFADPAVERERQAHADGYDLDLDIDIEAALDSVKKSEPPDPAPSSPRPSSRPPASERPLRSLREITPFAMPTPSALAASASLGTSLRSAPVPQPSGPPPPAGMMSRNPPPLPAAVMSRNPPPLPAGAGRSAAPKPQTAAKAQARMDGANHSAAGHGVSDDQIEGIYRRYLDARRQNSERTDNVKLETVAKTVREMMPKLTQKHAGKRIDFEVVVKDGRVALKPVAKDES